MIIIDYIKRTVSNNTNVKGWMSWDSIKENGRVVGELAKGMDPDEHASGYKADNFEEAMKHYGLTEADLKKRMRSHYMVAIVCALLALIALGWAVFLFIKAMYLSVLVALALSALMFVYAFREHLFYFKIRERRLNVSAKEWFNHFVSAKRK